MRDPALTPEEVAAALAATGAPEWRLVEGRLVKSVRCQGFAGSLAYVGAVGALAEAADHHPDIDIRYDRVDLGLVTHDSGGITWRDLDLAGRIDGIEAGVRRRSADG